ncbi:MAG: ATPase, T2SS/T4P/T4SS family [Acidimicrobiia bacterium]|nr:ATPase, T2SS/T4P/T4SS family [Acidimicrobiia bacterium]
MGIVERISRAIAESDTGLDGPAVEAAAARLLRIESPWSDTSAEVVNNVIGWGPLHDFFSDPAVSDILVNGPEDVWVDRDGLLIRTAARFESSEHLLGFVERQIAPLGLRIDRSSPTVEARLPDGSRLHAAIPPASVDVPVVAIRRFTQRVKCLEDLIATGFATDEQTEEMTQAVAARETIVVSGGTGTGKTTLLNLLGALIPSGERVVTIEDAAELSLPGHVVRLEARPANAERAGEITIRSLLLSALRLRPDRIVVGEVRGPEALDLITALNSGHRGSMTTVHANSPNEAMWRLETLALTAGSTSEVAIRRQLDAAVDLIIQLERTDDGRRIVEIGRLGAGMS